MSLLYTIYVESLYAYVFFSYCLYVKTFVWVYTLYILNPFISEIQFISYYCPVSHDYEKIRLTYELCGIDELWHVCPEGENILASILPNFYTEWNTEQR